MGKYLKKTSSAKKKEEAELERSYNSISPPKKKKSAKNRKRIVIICLVSLLSLAIVLCAGYLYLSNISLDWVILDNISVAGVDVGGMTQRQAIDALSAATEDTYGHRNMIVTVLDKTVEIPAEACSSLKIRSAVWAAYRYGHWGSESKRQEEQHKAITEGHEIDITPYLRLDTKAVKSKLEELGNHFNTTLSQSTYEIIGTAPDQKLVITLGVPEYGLNLNTLYNTVIAAYNTNRFEAEGHCGILEPAPVDLNAIHQESYQAPVDASFDKTTFAVIPHENGYGFDLEAAKAQLAEAAYGSTIEIPFRSIEPEMTADALSAVLFRDTLASYTATSGSSWNRDNNLKLACEAINGTVLYPGEVFSYNDTLGERTPERGYKPAATYMGDKTVDTYGGGICQVSSTLYYCTLMAELETVMRAEHSYANSYVPLGMDATVYWYSLDFKFKNNTNYPIRIEASASGGSTTVKLIGTDEKDYYIKMESETIDVYGYKTEYKEMPANNPEGYRDGQYITTPYTGYFVKSYRCKYDKQTNELISREFVEDSKYNSRNAVIVKIVEETPPATDGPDNSTGKPGTGGSITEDGALPPE